jgi:hypothetical protein
VIDVKPIKMKYACFRNGKIESVEKDKMYLSPICSGDYWKNITITYSRGLWKIQGQCAIFHESKGWLSLWEMIWKRRKIVSNKLIVECD